MWLDRRDSRSWDWLKRQSKILPLSHEETSGSEGNLNAYVSHFVFVYIYPLNGYRELDSYEEPCIGPGDQGSIPGWVIPKTQKMVLGAALLNTQRYKIRINGKVEQSREAVAPSLTPWCSTYRKGNLRVTLGYGRQLTTLLYIYIYIYSRRPKTMFVEYSCTEYMRNFI